MLLQSALLVASSHAAAFGPRPSRGQSVLATFDNLSTAPLASELNPVGVYDGLNWTSLDVLNAGVAGVTPSGFLPQSGANVAANSVSDDILDGGISITAATVSFFDLHYLYFGCVANTLETAASIPEQCTVAFRLIRRAARLRSRR